VYNALLDKLLLAKAVEKERDRVLSSILCNYRDIVPYIEPERLMSVGNVSEGGVVKILTRVVVRDPSAIGRVKEMMGELGYKGIHVKKTKNGVEVWGYIYTRT